jgi:hypothetical protein
VLLCHKILAPASKQPYYLPGTFVTVAAVFVLTAMYTDKLPLSGVIPCFAVPCLFARALRSFKCRVHCCRSLRYSYTLDENRIHQDITMLVIGSQSSPIQRCQVGEFLEGGRVAFFLPSTSTTCLAARSPNKYAPVAVSISSSDAVCSLANQSRPSGNPCLSTSTSRSALVIPT